MRIDVKPGEWRMVDFEKDPHLLLRSGFLGDAFTICAGIIAYFPETKVCAILHSPPSHRCGKSFFEWFDAQPLTTNTQIVIIPPKVSGSEPGIAFHKVKNKAEKNNCSFTYFTRTENLKISINSQGYSIYNSKNQLIAQADWILIPQKTHLPIFENSTLNQHFESDNIISNKPRRSS